MKPNIHMSYVKMKIQIEEEIRMSLVAMNKSDKIDFGLVAPTTKDSDVAMYISFE